MSAAATPLSANSTASTCGVSGTMMTMMSARLATSSALVHTVTPASTSACGAGLTSCTNSVCPAARRWPAIGAPMMPRPIKPTFR
ncbi:hypothetical protein D3C72_1951280 [compost metagenome]